MSRVLVGVTQRVMDLASRNERRDTLDQAWVPFLDACDAEAVAVPNRHPDPVAYLRRLGADAVVLTGGGNISSAVGTLDGRAPQLPEAAGDLAPERDVTETALLRASVEEGWPVVGVCRGMQVLNVFHGGGLAARTGHAGTRHTVEATADGLALGLTPEAEVNSFHDFGIPPNALGEGLRVLASCDGWPEAVRHYALPHLGIMWHPERNRPFSAVDVAVLAHALRAGR